MSLRRKYSKRVNITSASSAAFAPPSAPASWPAGISARGLCAGGGKPCGLAPVTVKAAPLWRTVNQAQKAQAQSTRAGSTDGRCDGMAWPMENCSSWPVPKEQRQSCDGFPTSYQRYQARTSSKANNIQGLCEKYMHVICLVDFWDAEKTHYNDLQWWTCMQLFAPNLTNQTDQPSNQPTNHMKKLWISITFFQAHCAREGSFHDPSG